MRPLRLEMQGFSAFRGATTVDFEGHDVVALTGATGAGKSTIIDGIGFALYGSVARYGNEKLVVPIINSVSTEARVRLDFQVGPTTYSAVRLVRRTATGASTKEARLERGGDVLAGTASELTTAVEELLGLNFDQFTKTVVLPQGDFARFLTETSGDRQGLLRRLLGLDVYAQMGSRARQRARDAATERDALLRALGGIEPVTDSVMSALTERAELLEAAVEDLDTAQEALMVAVEGFEKVEAVLENLDAEIDLLRGLVVPLEVKDLAREIAGADKTINKADRALRAAQEAFRLRSEASSALPTSGEAGKVVEQHGRLADLEVALDEIETLHTKDSKTLAKALAGAEKSARLLAESDERVRAAEQRAGAAGLAATLSAGDPCPVCARIIDVVPEHDPIEEIEDLKQHRASAAEAVHTSTEAVRAATASDAATTERRDRLVSDQHSLRDELAEAGTQKQATLTLAKSINAEDKLAAAKVELDETTTTVDRAHGTREAWQERERDLRGAFTAARDSVGSLGPPAPEGDSINDDWKQLASWARTTATKRRVERKECAALRTAAKRVMDGRTRDVARLCSAYVSSTDQDASSAAELLRQEARSSAIQLSDARERHQRDTANVARCEALGVEHAVADQLGKHLSATGFEQWLMRDVMSDLAERASGRLSELSSGSYSLATDGTDFRIRDHRNADELRSARTLSGGETFLASLALALSLADSITDLAVDSTPPIESMFLDEGFGTLDAETLDVVAAAIEELGAGGRLIAIVTHIRELAERIPARIHVVRTPAGSIVEDAPTARA